MIIAFLIFAVWCALSAAFAAVLKKELSFWVAVACFIINVAEYIYWYCEIYYP